MKLFLSALFCLTVVFSGCTLVAQDKHTLSADAYAQQLTQKVDGAVIDVRTPEEFAEGHLERAKNINFYDDNFKAQISTINKNKPVFIYCKSGGRSGKALTQLLQAGFTEVYNLDGGITAWKAKGLALEQ